MSTPRTPPRTLRRLTRRDFARTVGIVAGAALLPTPTTPARAHADPPPAPTPPPPTKLPAASLAEADARVDMIVHRYGPRLSPADRADLTRLSHDAQETLDHLRAYPLELTDEPAHIFRAPRRRH
jgi:hypothetical protein